jgi:centractin
MKAEEHRGALLLSYPMESGIVRDWSDMERLWSHIYSRENLNVACEEHAVRLVPPPANQTEPLLRSCSQRRL